MPDITAAMVKALREATNVSMMECKRALVETEGDADKATKLLRERGIAVAAKRATRATKQGIIASSEADGGKIGGRGEGRNALARELGLAEVRLALLALNRC